MKSVSDRQFREQWFCVKDFYNISGYRCYVGFCKNWVCAQHPKHKEYLKR